ncbi:hypothetical protein BOTBODRAFT_122294, partial [Botryobasidium botryosum FD-172 SS1]
MRALRTLMKDDSAGFRSREQARGVAIALTRKGYASFVLPTGSGKSLVFQLAAFAERPLGLVTVVFLPYTSLREDHTERAQAMGISALAWVSGETRVASLVFVVAESA